MFQGFFSQSYADARSRFITAAKQQGCSVQSYVNPAALGVDGEELATDVAYCGPTDARSLLVLTSAMHGEEGYCGSGCQVALLNDQALLGKAHANGIGILLIHAVNPYGFSWGHRTNEDNIDLNRNFCDFSKPLSENRHYLTLHPLLIPESWPPGADNAAAIQAFIDQEGEQAYREGMMLGQYSHPQGLFYGGRQPAWSNITLRDVLGRFGKNRDSIAWIDYHTGLGPYGHAEKIFVQKGQPEYLRARAWWGADVVSVVAPDSSTVDIGGTGLRALLEECSQVPELTFMALEYGTVPMDEVFLALRGDRWLAGQHDASQAQYKSMKVAHKAAFYPDHDDWRGAVVGQSRTSLLQAINGLSGS
ncbi:MAG TPA: M14 family metallopeptidase [Candidimonas sp.]|nr:M14 family metallopeptidase [Candidimonas sp.]